ILAKDNAGKLSLRGFKTEVFTDDVIASNYNEDFLPVNEIILNRLQETNGKGIVLLHGMPGTGKTSYIRYLISKLRKRVIYFPTDLVHVISSPDFIKFIADFTDSVFIIEDGEELIEQRNGGGSTTISNLLNISDGFLGDCLHIQIVCTFNAELAKIDKALLRKGRLIARYEFGPLGEAKCVEILKKLNINEPITRKMTLAELYNMSEPDFGMTKSKPVGFTNSSN
ncbi:MAG TPA: AAA family ATPase, partial [Bacteroidia bacterium]|nr:AAA family ATPase [Bacteroidia bacterium]